MSKKVIGITYKNVDASLDGFDVELLVGTQLKFTLLDGQIDPEGIIPVTNLELPVSKFKKLANVLVNNKLLKPTAKTFRLDKIFKLEQHKKNTPKKAIAKVKKSK